MKKLSCLSCLFAFLLIASCAPASPFDGAMAQTNAAMHSRREITWALGTKLGLAAALRSEGQKGEALAADLIAICNRLAAALEIKLPPFREISDDSAQNNVRAVGYILRE